MGNTDKDKLIPNPNVLLELGYAARAIGWERIICVMNEKYGRREEQIFNIRHRRLPIGYTLSEDEDISTFLPQLSGKIKNALMRLLWVEHNAVEDTISKLHIYCLTFLRQYANKDTIVPPSTSEFIIGAQAGTLDTPGFNHAINRLLDLGLVKSYIDPSVGKFVYNWTYLAILVLQKLVLRSVS